MPISEYNKNHERPVSEETYARQARGGYEAVWQSIKKSGNTRQVARVFYAESRGDTKCPDRENGERFAACRKAAGSDRSTARLIGKNR